MSQLLRLLSTAALPLCRAAGARQRLSAVTASRLLTAGYRSYAAPVSGAGFPRLIDTCCLLNVRIPWSSYHPHFPSPLGLKLCWIELCRWKELMNMSFDTPLTKLRYKTLEFWLCLLPGSIWRIASVHLKHSMLCSIAVVHSANIIYIQCCFFCFVFSRITFFLLW